MSWNHVSSETIRAPRNLTREKCEPRSVPSRWGGLPTIIPPEPPSVGGEAETTHHTWRCGKCRALLVTSSSGVPTTKCGKCK